MVSEITHNIRVSVKTAYQLSRSYPAKKSYVHAYWVKIENMSEVEVKLISRYWKIKDSGTPVKIVEGEGVVGEQPIIKPNESHAYSSWCLLTTPLGTMEGNYVLKNVLSGQEFEVKIPLFKLFADFIHN